MNKDGASIPIGFSVVFYQKSWKIIKENLMEAITDFYNGGNVPWAFVHYLGPNCQDKKILKLGKTLGPLFCASQIMSKRLYNQIAGTLNFIVN